MDFDCTPEQQAFRREVRAWLATHVPADLKGRGFAATLFWSQVDQDPAETATEILGPSAQVAAGSPWAPDEGQWEFYCLLARGSGIRAGTSEILRNILGERVLGLPKD